MAMKSITAIQSGYVFLWNSNVLYVKKFVPFIVKLTFCVTGAANELQRSIMFVQTGSLISLSNERSSLEEI